MTLNRDEQIFLHILFKGCTGKRLQLPLPLCAWQQRITPSPVIDQIVRLLNEHT